MSEGFPSVFFAALPSVSPYILISGIVHNIWEENIFFTLFMFLHTFLLLVSLDFKIYIKEYLICL